MRKQEVVHGSDESLSERLQFLLADARDVCEITQPRGIGACHFRRRDTSEKITYAGTSRCIGQLAPKLPQLLE